MTCLHCSRVCLLYIYKALEVIKLKLEEDDTLSERTPLKPDNIIQLLGLCLNCTYFLFQCEYYLQTHGAAIGSPVTDSLQPVHRVFQIKGSTYSTTSTKMVVPICR